MTGLPPTGSDHDDVVHESRGRDDWKDIVWKEYDYHAANHGTPHAAQVPPPPSSAETIMSLFAQDTDDDEWDDDMEFRFKGITNTIRIRGESLAGNTKVLQSTGLAVWAGGSSELAHFLVNDGSHFIQGKRVLELGSGTGIGGIIAYHVGAASVVWTDGDVDALENLRYNVVQNVHFDNDKQDTNHTSSKTFLSCPQLIWGQGLGQFREKYGTFDVILASDCIYMSKCVQPFWETVAYQISDVHDAVLIYVNTCVSQSPFEVMEKEAHRHGFVECKKASSDLIHIFRRATTRASSR